MPGQDTIRVEGRIVEKLEGRVFRAELANGHRVRAFLTGKARMNFARMGLGDKVLLEMSPYDLSEGRIIVESGNNLRL